MEIKKFIGKMFLIFFILLVLAIVIIVPVCMVFGNMINLNEGKKPKFVKEVSYDEATETTTYNGLFYTITVKENDELYEGVLKLFNDKVVTVSIIDKVTQPDGTIKNVYASEFMHDNDEAYFLKDKNKNYFIVYEGEPIKIELFFEEKDSLEKYENGNIVKVSLGHIRDEEIRKGVVSNLSLLADGNVDRIPAGVLTILTDMGYEFDIEFEPDYDYTFFKEHDISYFLRDINGTCFFVNKDNEIIEIRNVNEFKNIIDTFTNGDIIKVEYELIQETFPSSTVIKSIKFVSNGDLSNINSVLLKKLQDLGYIFEDDSLLNNVYFLRAKNGTCFFIDDNGPVVITNADIFDSFKEFKNGDRIRVYYDVVMESYPAKTSITGVEFIEKGDILDINKDILKSLKDLGWEFE